MTSDMDVAFKEMPTPDIIAAQRCNILIPEANVEGRVYSGPAAPRKCSISGSITVTVAPDPSSQRVSPILPSHNSKCPILVARGGF